MLYQALAKIELEQQSAALCTVVRTRGSTPRHAASKMIVYPDGHIEGTVGGGEVENRVIAEALQALQDGQPRFLSYEMADPSRGDAGVCGGQMEVFVEPIIPPVTVIVIGVGHVGKAVAQLAHWLSLRVLVCDDREELCNPENIPDADGYFPCQMAELPRHIPITPQTYLVLTTRGSDVDSVGLPILLETPAAYIGVIGSQRRWSITRQKLIDSGISEEKLNRVKSPIGLDIGGETPEEIAVSILGEIIAQRSVVK